MRGKHRSALGKIPASGAPLVALILTLVFAVILALTFAVGVALSENAPAAAPPQSGQPPNSPSTTPTSPPAMTILNTHEVESILGREVLSAANENMGRIVDVLVDRGGLVRAAIIDFGGFLGVGSRKIAVDWNALHFLSTAEPDKKVALELTRDQVKAAPEYQEGKPVVVLGPLGKLEPLPFE